MRADSIVASLADARIGRTFNQYTAQPRLCERLSHGGAQDFRAAMVELQR